MNWNEQLLAETRRRLFGEGIPRIRKCLKELSQEEIWYRPNDNSNSVGNLILHLCGNVRQWIIAGLGGNKDVRQRAAEFDEKGPLSTATLENLLHQLEQDVELVLTKVTAEDLLKTHAVQVYQETGISILVHVVEHFSYHVGQITYYVKWRKDMDTNYYPEDLG